MPHWPFPTDNKYMQDTFDDLDFNPLQGYPESIHFNFLNEGEMASTGENQTPVSEAGESEYAIISGYVSMSSPTIALEEKGTQKLESTLDCSPQSLMPKVEAKESATDLLDKISEASIKAGQIGSSPTNVEEQDSRESEQIAIESKILISLNSLQETNEKHDKTDTNEKHDQTEEIQIAFNSGIDITEEKQIPPLPHPLFLAYTPMINPLTTISTDKILMVDELDRPYLDHGSNASLDSSLTFKLRLRVALGSLTINKWRGDHKSKKSYILLSLRLLFMIYAAFILALSCNTYPASTVFSSFNIWSWIIMLLWLIMSSFVSLKMPKMTFGLSSTGIILYLFFATYSLCTPIPLILKMIGNAPISLKSWILELSLGSFGLIVLFSEIFFNQINLSTALMPVFVAGNSLIWATLFGINASLHGNVGEAFPWMSSYIIPGAIACLIFPVLCCWLITHGCRL